MTRRHMLLGVLFASVSKACARPTHEPGRVYPSAKSTTPLRVLESAIYSVTNANDRYHATVELDVPPNEQPVLALPRGDLRSEGWGTGSGSACGSASFELDRATADEVAALWRVPRRDRAPLGAGLVGRFAAKEPFVVGAPMQISVTLENTGSSPVWFNTGGRQRGPRDDRFRFGASRSGAALPTIEAYNFGGAGVIEPLEPGKLIELREELTKWVAIDRPGTYEVTCRYELELTTSAKHDRSRFHEQWDWATDGVIVVKVG